MSDCERFEELLSALLDGELSGQEEAEARAHLAACPECRAIYGAFAAVGAAIAGEDVPDTLHDGIMAKVHAAEKAKKTQSVIVRLRPILAAAACLVVLVGTVFALKNSLGMRSAPKNAQDATLFSATESIAAGGAASSVSGAAPEAAEEAPLLFDSKMAVAAAPKEAPVPEPAEAPQATADAVPTTNNATASGAAVPESAAQADSRAVGTLYGADEVYPTVMLGDALYEWRRGSAICFDGLPDGSVYYGEVSHTDAPSPQRSGEFASLFPVEGEIYTVPGSDDVVYLLLTTDWMEDTVVAFDRCG